MTSLRSKLFLLGALTAAFAVKTYADMTSLLKGAQSLAPSVYETGSQFGPGTQRFNTDAFKVHSGAVLAPNDSVANAVAANGDVGFYTGQTPRTKVVIPTANGQSYTGFVKSGITDSAAFVEIMKYGNHSVLEQMTTSASVKTMMQPNGFKVDNPFPMPFNPSTNINYTMPLEGRVTVSVYGIDGKLVDRNSFNASAGSHTYNVNLSNQSTGTYFIHVESPFGFDTKKAQLTK